ncbi:zinc ribbon domain-containing protein [Megasphaera elsdenii]|uniref:zinc ribbon domain-containing protein n=1 Tax=Megasphaera elsdenii TaxID=907 RepID=UPI003C6D0AC8
MSGQWIYTCSPHDTSITCPVCGHVERANRLQNEHRFVCRNCGYGGDTIVDDDENAARNIYERGKANLGKEFGNTLST